MTLQIGDGATGEVYAAKWTAMKCAAKKLKDYGDGLIEQAYKVGEMLTYAVVPAGR